MGPQGPSGLTGQVVAMSALTMVSLMANEQKTFDLVCPNSKRVFGGGYEAQADAAVVPIASYPSSQTAWRVVIRLSQSAAASFNFRIYAVCATSN
jgi:hypothetical protein